MNSYSQLLKQLTFAHQLKGIIFPPICRICSRSMEIFPDSYICQSCLSYLPFISSSRCLRCGLPSQTELSPSFDCNYCRNLQFHIDYTQSALVANQESLNLIYQLKYGQATWLARTIARVMVRGCVGVLQKAGFGPDLPQIVPVPLHISRMKERGYNQSALISKYLSKNLHIPVLHKTIIRTKATNTQTGFGRSQRFDNVKNAFSPGPKSTWVEGKNIFLVDDVMTTGATLSECAKQLKFQGARSVTAVTALRGQFS